MKDHLALSGVLLLSLWPAAADGQALYKCVAKGKAPSYQSAPCPPNTRIAAIRAYEPEAEPTAGQVRLQQAREAKGRKDSAYLSRIAGTDRRARAAGGHVMPSGGSDCEATRRARDDWERRVGLSRTYESLLAWNDRVQRACR